MVVGKGTFKFRMAKRGRGPRIIRKKSSKYGKYASRGTAYDRIAKVVKSISLKNAETKDTHVIAENIQLYHNVENIRYSFLYTQQGIGDGDTGTTNYACRVGNEIICRGLSIKLWFANKLDRPNIMYRIIIFKYRADTTIGSAYKVQGSTNYMIRDIDNEKITVLKSKLFNLQTSLSASANVVGGGWDLKGKEAHRYVKFWIPMKNMKLRYKDDNSGSPKYTDIGISIVPYDSYGTLTTDNVASYAISHKLYFKDP